MEPWWEPKSLKEIQDIFPTNRMEGFLDLKLEKEGRLFPTMKPSRIILHEHKMIMNAS
jgi:hypothetical protein